MSEKPDTKNHPTVKALVAHRDRLDVSDAIFASRYLGMSKTTWSQLQSGTYPAEDPRPMLERCEAALRLLNDRSEEAEAGGDKAKIINLPHVRAALKAVKDCYEEDQNRLVLYMGGTGAGKTTLARRLRENYLGGAICLEATESWRGSYYYALMGVADALGMLDTSTNPRVLETQVFERLEMGGSPILVIDEGHYCGPAALNLIKAILNKTGARVVLIAIPALWDRMEKKAYEEAKQLRRRTFAKIVVTEVKLADARAFLAGKMAGYDGLDEEGKAVAACCEAANKFGLYDTLQRVCDEVRREMGDKPVAATLDRVAAAIKRVEALRA